MIAQICLVLARLLMSWDLSMVLYRLVLKPFEPMAICPPHMLAWKIAFLVAITLARRVSELQTLRANPPYLMIHTEGATLSPDISILPKVPSNFHLST